MCAFNCLPLCDGSDDTKCGLPLYRMTNCSWARKRDGGCKGADPKAWKKEGGADAIMRRQGKCQSAKPLQKHGPLPLHLTGHDDIGPRQLQDDADALEWMRQTVSCLPSQRAAVDIISS